MYSANAISACFGSNSQYPTEPISFKDADEEKTINSEAKKFDAFAIMFNEEFKKKNASEDK